MRRKAWVAALLSAFVAGLGQMYNARLRRGLVTYGAVVIAGVISIFLFLYLPGAPINVLVACGIAAGAWLYNIFDAARTARAVGSRFEPRPYNRWYMYALVLLLALFLVQPRSVGFLKSEVAESYRIPSVAMAPTILPGDYVIARKLYRPANPAGTKAQARFRPADLVVFASPEMPPTTLLKRVVALPGDRVAMRGKVLFINGVRQQEPYVKHVDPDHAPFTPAMMWQAKVLAPGSEAKSYRPTRDNWGPLVVPAGAYFVLGDNRDDSLDSRYFGFISEERIVGQPKRIYFSRDPGTGRVRWERIGQATW